MKLVRLILILTILFLLNGCTVSKGPAVGSPEWLWAAARDAYTAGDYDKAAEQLSKIEKKGDNPYVERAVAWRLLIEAGSANAQMELAKAYADGSTITHTDKALFQRPKDEHLKEARRHAIELFEGYGNLSKQISDKPIVLEFPFPQGSAAKVAELDRVSKGLSVPDEAQAAAANTMVKRGVVRAVDTVLATEDDAATAQDVLKSGRAEVPVPRYLTALAISLSRVSMVFDRKNLNEVDKQKLFMEKSLELSQRALELKPDPDTQKALTKLHADLEKQAKEMAKKSKP
jgi:tetratricopeptide (TPR) repeat protein